MEVLEHVTTTRERGWSWFVEHAKSRYALLWLALLGFADTVFFPISVEAFLAVLVLAHRDRWRTYLAVSITSSTAGAIAGYWLLFWLFRSFGEPLLAQWGIGEAYSIAQTLLGGQIFLTMLLASFTPLPDKLFIYAAGILGAPFLPYIAGFIIGRGARMAVVTYLVWKFGPTILESINKYSLYSAVMAVAILALYVIFKLHLVPGL
jgi:membrane protein YqaA with SNARE-associated domain